MRHFASLLSILLVTGFLSSARNASADIIVLGGTAAFDVENVNLDDATNVPTVTGLVGGAVINFTSTGGNLNAEASGQARITGAHDPFTNVLFSIASGFVFTGAEFNLFPVADGDLLIRVLGINLDGGAFQTIVELDGNGQNRYNIQAVNNQFIRSIELIGNDVELADDVVFEDLRQVRIGGVQSEELALMPVPEPASLLLAATGLTGVAAVLRRRGRQR